MSKGVRAVLVVAVAAVVSGLASPSIAAPGDLTLASTDDAGTTKGNGASEFPSLSDDGTKVAFVSTATNLDAGDSDSIADVYVKDLATGDIALVSTSDRGGGQGERRYLNRATSSYDPLTLHWDGADWSIAPSPGDLTADEHLDGLSAASATDIWAVVDSVDQATGDERTLILHWDGATWSRTESPNPGVTRNDVNAVSAVSATDVWTVGRYLDTSGVYKTLRLHWDAVGQGAASPPLAPPLWLPPVAMGLST